MKYLDIKLPGIDKDGHEKEYKLLDFKGQKAVLYFYPKDDTSGCTQEASDFRDNFNRLANKAVIIGVSPDGIKSHKKFRENHGINFILLSDTEHKLSEAFKVWSKKHMGISRSTFILDEKGNITHEWRDVKVPGHVDEVIAKI